MSPDGKLVNTPCQGYSDGDITGHGTLGYLCEARPTEAISEDGAVKVCHFPFGFNNATYHGCVGPDVADPECAAHSWCATKVDENGLMVPGKWAFCSDERSMAYSQLEGHYCSVPFLMNKRYYETCTRQTLDPNTRMEHYWCASKLDTSLTETYVTGLKGKCSDYLIPQDEGCQDHFHLAGNKCVRISTFLVTFDDAHNACLDEGAELLTIEDGQISKDLQILLQNKRQKYLHYFQTNVFWVGAEYQNGWKWINSRTNQLKPFGPYTNWKTNMPDLGCPPTMGCSNISRIYVDAESGFTWKAAQREELIGYICQSRCTPPYKWSKNLNSCIYVAISNKTIPEAIVDCAKTNATLYAFRNCAELELLRLDMLDAGVPRNANYAIGMFRGLQNSWNSRNPTKAKFQNSKDQGLCLARDDYVKLHLRVPVAFGLHLNEAKLSTYNENLNDPNTRLQKHHYVCQMDDNFACPKDYHKYSDTCLKIVHDAELDMMEAKMACREEKGMILAITANSLDVQVITEFIKQNQSHENTSQYWMKAQSFQMGSALFGGKSYLDLAKGLEGGKGFSIFFTIELWELTHLATIMDFRDPNNETNGLLIELRNGAPVFILRNNQGPQEFQTIDSSRMTEPNKFASYGITYDSVTKRGTIYRDQTYGFQNGSTELSVSRPCARNKRNTSTTHSFISLEHFLQGNYFHLDAEDWFVTALRHPGRLGSSRIDPSSQGLQGGLSCVQIYNTALSPGQVLEMDHCAEKHEKCYPGQIHWDDKCFKMSHRKASFAQAEVKCNAKGETGYKSQLIHSMEPDLLDYLSRILKENTGESSFWEYCGIRGATVYAAKTKAQLEFAREYAKMNIKRDIWMGVQIGLKQHFVDEDMYIPLRVMESDDKFYADGMVFDETIDFNFNIVSSSGHWNGPCVFLRASYGYKARNTKCTQEFGFLCEWREPQCPEDYTLAPELGPRSCYKTLSHPGPYGSDSCHDSADNLRKLAWPRSTKALEAFRSRTRITSGSIWLGAELSDNQTWMDGRGGILEVPGALQDLREDGIWYHDPPSNQTAACYTTQGKQCIFPFSYQNVSASGEVTDLEYTKCSTLDVFLPWCATEVDDAKNVLDWGFCVPDCPSEVVEVACLSEPDFPVFVTPWDASDLVNFTTSYDQGSALVTKELDFVSFQCPEGYVFEGSNNITHYAMCHNWEYLYLFDRTARCERVACPCPPKFSKDSVVSGTTDWNTKFWTCLENETFPQDTHITYTCPEGYVFETPQLLAFGQENSELFVKCETYADWNVTRKPKCVQLPCPRAPPKAPEGGWLWFGMDQTKYQCPNGYEFQGGSGPYMVTECAANRKWRPSVTRKCVLQTSTCIWSNDDDNMIWFPNEIEECLHLQCNLVIVNESVSITKSLSCIRAPFQLIPFQSIMYNYKLQ
ncbi:hypothetical protein TCAL_06223 [Tigriopus californicus]|uniref:C-type lectin domain-containing protein n=1 Tax=Tigriopus californicus TaxID=6832 RepID=A0A553PKH2_TIGCA|nr:hypothetical protein TCAL_06223 [Tigriopus californicus]